MRSILRNTLLLAAAVTLLTADQSSDQFNVTVTVDSACTVTAHDLDFGTYDGTVNEVDTTIDVYCTLFTPYSLYLDPGEGGEADFDPRQMDGDTNSSQILNYNLYTNSGRTTIWGDGSGSSGIQSGFGAGTGIAVVHYVYGRIPSGQNVQPQGYTDLVTATVDY